MNRTTYSQSQLEMAIRKLGFHGTVNGHKGTYHCLYHQDKTPSFKVDFHTSGYNCLSCGRHGSISQLCMDRTGKGIGRVILSDSFSTWANPSYNIPVEERLEVPITVMGTILPWKLSPEAQAYTRSRGIPDEISESMEMGYLNQGTVNGTKMFKRLVIPTYAENGILINAEFRDVTRQSEIKVLYPREALKPVYQWWMLDKTQPAYTIEGLIKMAVLRSDPYFKNSTTTLGSNISTYQEKQIRTIPDLIVILDNDRAGEKYLKLMREVRKGLKTRAMRLDAPIKDVDEIPTKLRISVQQFREKGKFVLEQNSDFN